MLEISAIPVASCAADQQPPTKCVTTILHPVRRTFRLCLYKWGRVNVIKIAQTCHMSELLLNGVSTLGTMSNSTHLRFPAHAHPRYIRQGLQMRITTRQFF